MGSIDYTNVYDGALIQHARKRIMAESPHIETTSDDLVNFNTDISAPLKACKIYFEPEQEGEGDPSPENIRPIKGRASIELKHAGINLCENITLKNGAYYEWYIPKALLNQNLIFSMEVDNTNGANEACMRVVFKDKDDITLKSIARASGIPSGYKARDAVSLNESIPSNTDHIYFGTSGNNFVIADPMVKIFTDGNMWDTSDYEPYTGTTVPITFPAINMLDYIATAVNKTISNKGEEANETGMSITDFIKVNQGDIYTLTFLSKEAGRTRRIYGYDANKEPIEQLTSASWVNVGTTRSLQATVPSGVEYIRVCYKTADENIFLEGPESSTFYGGYVDLVNGKLIQEWIQVKINSLSWTYMNSGECFRSPVPMERRGRKEISPVRSSIYETLEIDWTISSWADKEDYSISEHIGNVGDKLIQSIHIKDSRYTTVSDFLNGVGNENIVYKLLTPIEYSITPQTLKTLRGINNIWSTSNGHISIKYWKH